MEPAATNRGLLTMQESIVQSPHTVPGQSSRAGYAPATLRILERLDCRPIPKDRSGGTHPFRVGGWYASCPRCHTFAMVQVDPDGIGWQSVCGCFTAPGRKLDELDLIVEVRRAA